MAKKQSARPKVEPSDPYLSKLVKYIPADVIAAYVAIYGFIKLLETKEQQFVWHSIVAGVLLFATPLWILYTARSSDERPTVSQAVAGTIAFAAWVFAIGGPFEMFQKTKDNPDGWYHRAQGSIVLILVCLFLPLTERVLSALWGGKAGLTNGSSGDRGQL